MAKEIYNVGCPFCSWNRFLKDEPQFDRIDPTEVKVLSTRISIGGKSGEKRSGHFKTISVTKIEDLSEKYKSQIRRQAQKILDALET